MTNKVMERVKRLLAAHHPTTSDLKVPGLKEPQLLTLDFHSLDMIAVAECTSSAADRGGVAEIAMTGTAVRNGNLWVYMRRKIPLKDKEITDALQTPAAAALGAVKLCGQLCRLTALPRTQPFASRPRQSEYHAPL